MGVIKTRFNRSALERAAIAGDSPVGVGMRSPVWYPSRVGHVKPGLNRRGPSRKAKHSMTTDSEPSRATERWEEPRQGEDTEPETPCLRAVGGRLAQAGLTACLLHNDPASYRVRLVNPFRGGAVAKASLNRAKLSGAVDAKPGELPMGRLKRP